MCNETLGPSVLILNLSLCIISLPSLNIRYLATSLDIYKKYKISINNVLKSNLRCTRGITSESVKSGATHLCGLALAWAKQFRKNVITVVSHRRQSIRFDRSANRIQISRTVNCVFKPAVPNLFFFITHF